MTVKIESAASPRTDLSNLEIDLGSARRGLGRRRDSALAVE